MHTDSVLRRRAHTVSGVRPSTPQALGLVRNPEALRQGHGALLGLNTPPAAVTGCSRFLPMAVPVRRWHRRLERTFEHRACLRGRLRPGQGECRRHQQVGRRLPLLAITAHRCLWVERAKIFKVCVALHRGPRSWRPVLVGALQARDGSSESAPCTRRTHSPEEAGR